LSFLGSIKILFLFLFWINQLEQSVIATITAPLFEMCRNQVSVLSLLINLADKTCQLIKAFEQLSSSSSFYSSLNLTH
jgi:hypothetical protein